MSAKPIKEIRVGSIKATIWENDTAEGKRFKSITLQKSYKDDKGEWHETSFFSEYDAGSLLVVLQRAIMELPQVHDLKNRASESKVIDSMIFGIMKKEGFNEEQQTAYIEKMKSRIGIEKDFDKMTKDEKQSLYNLIIVNIKLDKKDI